MLRRIICLLSIMASPAAFAQAPSAAASAPQPTLAEAFALIVTRPKVDLTHAFGPMTPVSRVYGQARMTPAVDPDTLEAYTIARDGFRATYFAMVGPYGTHVDPPAHVAPTGQTLDEIPLDQMILPLVVLDDTPYLAAEADASLLGRRPRHMGGRARTRPKGIFRRAADRHGQGLDARAGPFPRRRFPGLVPAGSPGAFRTAWHRRHRP